MANRVPAFNDGMMKYGDVKTVREMGKFIKDEFVAQGFYYFGRLDARITDYAFVEGLGGSLDKKIRTPFSPLFLEAKPPKALISGDVYDVVSIDWNADQTILYWYLQKGDGADGI